jgi:hypothetical protein
MRRDIVLEKRRDLMGMDTWRTSKMTAIFYFLNLVVSSTCFITVHDAEQKCQHFAFYKKWRKVKNRGTQE